MKEITIVLLGISICIAVSLRFLSKSCLCDWATKRSWFRTFLLNVQDIYASIRGFIKKNPYKLLVAFLFSVLHWFMGAIELCLILYLLDISPIFLSALTIDMGVVILKSIGGFVPGQLGVEEMGNKWMLALVGIQGASIWVAVSIIRRAKQLCWIMISIAIYFLPKYLKNKKQHNYGRIIHNA